ncbi:MAG: peptidoglycan-associated lipoprotein Pal [Alphaproteobacteria bacterium]|nr:peptidoglycan-associated lipoprotein Pal [Alphaproteobacteria bacterium]MCY4231865.1 peptidoglycan-associated lipoprotein Pal [Alphaproteobacteria bacterium]MCY4317676.1 peptidoglycan-associated lipoprotein Pal [Alphaproteobacteria bacterium]
MPMKLLASAMALLLLAACETGSNLDDDNAAAATGTQAESGQNQGVDSQAVAPPPGSAEELQQIIGDKVNFAYDRHDLDTGAQDQVTSWANWLTAHSSLSVVIEGHADERGTREYNLALGERRAAEVRSYLLASGIAANRVRIVSYGKERPLAVESNEEAWAINRRAVMILD